MARGGRKAGGVSPIRGLNQARLVGFKASELAYVGAVALLTDPSCLWQVTARGVELHSSDIH